MFMVSGGRGPILGGPGSVDFPQIKISVLYLPCEPTACSQGRYKKSFLKTSQMTNLELDLAGVSVTCEANTFNVVPTRSCYCLL